MDARKKGAQEGQSNPEQREVREAGGTVRGTIDTARLEREEQFGTIRASRGVAGYTAASEEPRGIGVEEGRYGEEEPVEGDGVCSLRGGRRVYEPSIMEYVGVADAEQDIYEVLGRESEEAHEAYERNLEPAENEDGNAEEEGGGV